MASYTLGDKMGAPTMSCKHQLTVKMDGHTQGYQQNQHGGHQQAEGDEPTRQA